MTKSIVVAIFLTFTILSFSFGQNQLKRNNTSTISKDTSDNESSYWLTPQKMTPLSFLEAMKTKSNQVNNLGVVTMTDAFSNNWLTKADIDTLIRLVHSKEKCNCFLNPISSYIPNDSADIGGYAIRLIESYKQKKKLTFGLYACPKANDGHADNLIKWWAQQHKQLNQ